MLRCDMIPYNYFPIAYGPLHIIALCVGHMELIVLFGKVIMDISIFYEKFRNSDGADKVFTQNKSSATL